MTVWLVVPTAGTRAQLLDDLVASCGLPRDRIVVITTDPFATWPDGVHRLHDGGGLNVHRWWNAGIDYAQQRGATVAVVANDDVGIDADAIPALVAALHDTGAAVASPSTRDPGVALHRGPLEVPPVMRLDGALWALDLATGLRPDPVYHWWFGDNDLSNRARLDHGGVVTVGSLTYRHWHPSEATFTTPALQRLAAADEQTYRSRWH